MHFNQPVHQDGSHSFVDVGLIFHEYWTNRRASFFAAEVVVHILHVAGSAKWIISVAFINVISGPILVTGRVRQWLLLCWIISVSDHGERSFIALTLVAHRSCRFNWVTLFHQIRMMLITCLTSWNIRITTCSPFFWKNTLTGLSILSALVCIR